MIRKKAKFEGTFLIIAVIPLLALMFTMLWVSGPASDEYTVKDYKEEKIIGLQDNQTINGRFYLGSGQINQEMYYHYMRKEEDGSSRMQKAPAEMSKVFEYEGKEPRVEIKEVVYKDFIKRLLFDTNYEYHFYIPKGSVKEGFNIDLE